MIRISHARKLARELLETVFVVLALYPQTCVLLVTHDAVPDDNLVVNLQSCQTQTGRYGQVPTYSLRVGVVRDEVQEQLFCVPIKQRLQVCNARESEEVI